jgi:GNAT superfamily N-acetyltransferase
VTNAGESPAALRLGGGDSDLDERLGKELGAYNVGASGCDDQREFTVKVEDDQGLVAGLSGWTWGTCAGIAMVWVREDSRRSGVGRRLLATAEQVARDRACLRLTVSSFTFQAPAFYERYGFVEFARTEGLPVEGQADVHFVKVLAQ